MSLRKILVLSQIIAILIIINTIENNDSFAFTISEEMDYSMPFDFLDTYKDTNGPDDQFEENNNFQPETDVPNNRLNSMDSVEHYDIYTEDDGDSVSDKFDQDLIRDGQVDSLNELQSTETIDDFSSDIEMGEVVENDIIEKNSEIDKEPDKIAIINFDDNWLSQYENAKPILDNYQFKATFYIVCDYINGKNRMTLQQLETLQKEGHEIGSHTMNHENLDEIMPDAKYHEIVESKKCMEDNGFKINSFSYPFNSGDDNQESLELVASNYDFARTAGGTADSDNLGKHNDYERFTIIGWSHDAERKKHNYSDLQMLDVFKEYVDKSDIEGSSSNGNTPIIIYHNIDDERGVYNTSIDLFNSEMQYLYENGFKVVTMNDVFGENSYE